MTPAEQRLIDAALEYARKARSYADSAATARIMMDAEMAMCRAADALLSEREAK